MLVSREALSRGHTVAIYSLPRLLAEIRSTFDDETPGAYADFLTRLARRRPAAHRRPRRREDEPVGARAALLDRQRPLRGRARDRDHDEPRPRAARRADRRADGVAARADVRRLPAARQRQPAHRGGGPAPGSAAPRPTRRTCGWPDQAKSPPYTASRYAEHRDRGRPVGRRGQGQGRRPARRARVRGGPLPGRQQRRPHDRARGRDVQVPPDPLGHPLPRRLLRDRQRRRRRPRRPDVRDRRPA